MKKKTIIILIVSLVLLGVICAVGCIFGVKWLFSEQYNEHGVSHWLVITIDKNSPREYLGELDGYKIYIEQMNLDETVFRNINAENVPIKKALEEKLVSMADWRKYAWSIQKTGDTEILKNENYEIACVKDECTIRPLYR